MKTKLTILGTGNALAVKCYNTCFALENRGEVLLVDAGGGNGIFIQLEKAGIEFQNIRAMYLTHGHTDHILGAIWVVRKVAQMMGAGKYPGQFHIYGHEKVISMLETFCTMTLTKKLMSAWGSAIRIHVVADGDSARVCGMDMTFFDIFSTKEKQFGFRAELPDGNILCCLGDEPYNEKCGKYVEGCDFLMAEAFCLYSMAERFKPYEKHHSTALDAGRLAEELGVKTLLLYHTEDETLKTRKEAYTKEAASQFSGPVYVPDDLETIYI